MMQDSKDNNNQNQNQNPNQNNEFYLGTFKIKDGKIDNAEKNIFYMFSFKFIVPFVSFFGILFAIFAPLTGISYFLYICILLLLFGYVGIMIISYIIFRVKILREDIRTTGFSFLGVTKEQK